MRILALLVVFALVVLPLVGCGVGASINTCKGACEECGSSDECCHNNTCTIFTSDARARCSAANFVCKLSP
jgi:hypothetical protein